MPVLKEASYRVEALQQNIDAAAEVVQRFIRTGVHDGRLQEAYVALEKAKLALMSEKNSQEQVRTRGYQAALNAQSLAGELSPEALKGYVQLRLQHGIDPETILDWLFERVRYVDDGLRSIVGNDLPTAVAARRALQALMDNTLQPLIVQVANYESSVVAVGRLLGELRALEDRLVTGQGLKPQDVSHLRAALQSKYVSARATIARCKHKAWCQKWLPSVQYSYKAGTAAADRLEANFARPRNH